MNRTETMQLILLKAVDRCTMDHRRTEVWLISLAMRIVLEALMEPVLFTYFQF